MLKNIFSAKFCGRITMEMWIQGRKKKYGKIPTILKDIAHKYADTVVDIKSL